MAGISVLARLQVLFDSYLPRGWQALALCLLRFQLERPGSDYHQSETQIPQTHTNKTCHPDPQLCPHKPKEMGTLNSLALTQNLSYQVPPGA